METTKLIYLKLTKLILFLLVLLASTSYSLFSQYFKEVHGTVVDSVTKEKIPFANIMLRNKANGTTSNESGKFSLRLSECSINDYIVISHVGYKSKIFNTDSLWLDTIYLQQCTYVLEEVEIINQVAGSGIIIINNFNLKDCMLRYALKPFNDEGHLHVPFRPNEPTIEALYFPFKEDYSGKVIKEVRFYVENLNDTPARFRIRILMPDENNKPFRDIPLDQDIIYVDSDSQVVSVDISNHKMQIPRNGIYIGFEILMIEENVKWITNEINVSASLYSPYLYVKRVKKVGDYWLYSGGMWKESRYWYFKRGIWFMEENQLPSNDTYRSGPYVFEPAISLTLIE